MIKLFTYKMNVKESLKTNCLYCLRILSDPKEIELNYHISCKAAFEEFEKEDKRKLWFLSKSLSLTQSQIMELLQNGYITIILDKNNYIKELKINSSIFTNWAGRDHISVNHILLPTTELQDLQSLAISYNYSWDHENGWWKSDLTEVQENIGDLKNLEKLDLSGNSITTLPDSIRDLTNLKVLYLQGNDLKEFPNVITKLCNLETLNLNDNSLFNLPTGIKDLGNLKSLGIDVENILSFSEFGVDMTNLEELTIYPYFQSRMFMQLREIRSFNNFPKPAQVCLKKLRRRGCIIKQYR